MNPLSTCFPKANSICDFLITPNLKIFIFFVEQSTIVLSNPKLQTFMGFRFTTTSSFKRYLDSDKKTSLALVALTEPNLFAEGAATTPLPTLEN